MKNNMNIANIFRFCDDFKQYNRGEAMIFFETSVLFAGLSFIVLALIFLFLYYKQRNKKHLKMALIFLVLVVSFLIFLFVGINSGCLL